MNDRELLEMAAKAAGYTAFEGQAAQLVDSGWNPRDDDGEAFRLAVRLGIFDDPRFHHFRSLERFGRQDKDDCYATRLAILRTAAEIGKAM